MGEADLLKMLLELLLSFPDRSIAVGAATKALNVLRNGYEVCTLSIGQLQDALRTLSQHRAI